MKRRFFLRLAGLLPFLGVTKLAAKQKQETPQQKQEIPQFILDHYATSKPTFHVVSCEKVEVYKVRVHCLGCAWDSYFTTNKDERMVGIAYDRCMGTSERVEKL